MTTAPGAGPDSPAPVRRRGTATAWALPIVFVAGWATAVALVWLFVLPGLAAAVNWGMTPSAQVQRRTDVALAAALALVIATPAVDGWLAWRRGWRVAAWCFWVLAGGLAVLLCGWWALQEG